MQLAVEKRILLTTGIFLALAAAISLGVVWPTIRQIRGVNSTIYNLRVYLEKKNYRFQQLRNSNKQLQTAKVDAAEYQTHIFRRGEELKLITLLESTAAKHFVSQKILSSNLDTSTGDHVDLSVALDGTYANIVSYIKELEALPYFIIIRELKLTPATDRLGNVNSNSVQLNVMISLYVNQ